MFITFEGPDGSGKSTQAEILAEKLKQQGIKTILTSEPYSEAPICAKIKEILEQQPEPNHWTELFLYLASRAEHMKKVIAPALNKGYWVICDRFMDSSVAYQGAAGIPKKKIIALNQITVGNIIPNITFFLDIDHQTAMKRLKLRGNLPSRYESGGPEHFKSIRENYITLQKMDFKRIMYINAAQPIDNVSKKIWDVIKTKIKF